MKCRECGHSVLVDMQKKSEKNVRRYLHDNGWLTIDRCVERKYRIRIDDIEDSVYAAMCERLQQIENAVFAYIQQRIKELHSRKLEFECKLHTKARKRSAVDTKPLKEPLSNWDALSVQEKHDIAAEMIEVVYISHYSEDIEIKFGI